MCRRIWPACFRSYTAVAEATAVSVAPSAYYECILRKMMLRTIATICTSTSNQGPQEGIDHLFLLPERVLGMDSVQLRKDLAALDFKVQLLQSAPSGNVWLCKCILCFCLLIQNWQNIIESDRCTPRILSNYDNGSERSYRFIRRSSQLLWTLFDDHRNFTN